MGAERNYRRNQEILTTVVRMHIATGEPVASASVAREHSNRLSPATIRNVMAQLDTEGYLEQPHTSAGRVPTAKAYEFYARQMANLARLPRADRRWIDTQLLYGPTEPQALLPRASHVLSELGHGIGIVLIIPFSQVGLRAVRFLRVDEQRVLVVLLTQSGLVRDKLVVVREPFTQTELDRIAAYINEEFSGWALEAVRAELERRTGRERSSYERLAASATALCRESLEEISETAEVYVEGTANLIARAGETPAEELSALLRALEEKEKLVRLLREAQEPPEPCLQIHIGLEQVMPPIRHFALISAPYGSESAPLGTLAILGPTRMDYPRAITAVGYVARLFTRMLSEN